MLLAVFEIWLYVAAERLSSKMTNRLSDVVRSRQQKLYELKDNVGMDSDAHLCKMFYSRLMRQPFAVARTNVGRLC